MTRSKNFTHSAISGHIVFEVVGILQVEQCRLDVQTQQFLDQLLKLRLAGAPGDVVPCRA